MVRVTLGYAFVMNKDPKLCILLGMGAISQESASRTEVWNILGGIGGIWWWLSDHVPRRMASD